jgi:hypothetical protein
VVEAKDIIPILVLGGLAYLALRRRAEELPPPPPEEKPPIPQPPPYPPILAPPIEEIVPPPPSGRFKELEMAIEEFRKVIQKWEGIVL